MEADNMSHIVRDPSNNLMDEITHQRLFLELTFRGILALPPKSLFMPHHRRT